MVSLVNFRADNFCPMGRRGEDHKIEQISKTMLRRNLYDSADDYRRGKKPAIVCFRFVSNVVVVRLSFFFDDPMGQGGLYTCDAVVAVSV